MNKAAKLFAHSFAILCALFVLGLMLQHPGFESWLKYGLLLAVTVPAFMIRGRLLAILTSYQFAITLLGSIVITVILGTFIIQNGPVDEGMQRYGNLYNVIRFIHLDRVFDSYWFNLFLSVTAASLILVLIKRKPFRLTQAGFLLSHVGVILILAGGLIGRIFGSEGFIELQEGLSASSFQVMQNGNLTENKENLNFAIQLNDFQVDYYNADYKIYAYSFDPSIQNYKAIASYDIAPSKAEKIPGSDLLFEVGKIEKKKYLETGHNMAGKHYLKAGQQEAVEVQIGKTYELAGQENIEILEFLPHFVYDIEQRKAMSLSDSPKNPALRVRVHEQTGEREQWLFANMPDYYQMHAGSKHQPAVSLVYSYELPSCCNKEVPLIELLVKTKRGVAQESLTYDPENPLFLEDGKIALVLDKREGEVKEYRSVASIVEQGQPVTQASIAVNHPLKYAGYSFYQSNYNPDDLSYSGFRVVKDPGLPVVYTGAAILCLGVFWIFYLTPAFIRARQRKQERQKEVENVA